ncbi:MAG: SDR family NAD(P)-dependent oxidoreductase [Acidimicrobiales bacterium]|nr:SDR family NAD(P)-dependent oxidoreductase [Acidimicrobiales bacterium]
MSMATPESLLTDFSNRVVVVTGGSRGLGLAMVEAFARCGADVVIASRKFSNCEEAAIGVQEKTGRRTLPVACHVGDWDQCDALVAATYDAFGSCDVLINNAGSSPLYPSLVDVGRELFDKTLAVNLRGTFRLSASFGSRMVADGGGSIINVSSTSASAPTPGEAIYGAAKAGVQSLTESFARAYGPLVRVNCLQPGPFLTDVSTHWPDNVHEGFRKRHALQRAGNTGEIVGAALYLASDAASFTTGSVIKVDGGAVYGSS